MIGRAGSVSDGQRCPSLTLPARQKKRYTTTATCLVASLRFPPRRIAPRCDASSAAPRPGVSRSDAFHLISNWKPGPQSGRRGITPRSGVTRRCGLKENQLAVSREPESSQASASPSQSDYLHFGRETSISPVFVVAVTESGSLRARLRRLRLAANESLGSVLVDQSPTA